MRRAEAEPRVQLGEAHLAAHTSTVVSIWPAQGRCVRVRCGNAGAEGAPEPAAGRRSPNLTAAPGVVFGFLKGFAISERFILSFTSLPLQKPCRTMHGNILA